jgi:hypothetical protein
MQSFLAKNAYMHATIFLGEGIRRMGTEILAVMEVYIVKRV